MKYRTFAKTFGDSFEDCAYIYCNGILFHRTEKYKGKPVDFWYWHNSPIRFGIAGKAENEKAELSRIVVHSYDASIFRLGEIKSVELYLHNSSEASRKTGHDRRSMTITLDNGAHVRADAWEFEHYYFSGFTAQGTGALSTLWDEHPAGAHYPDSDVETFDGEERPVKPVESVSA